MLLFRSVANNHRVDIWKYTEYTGPKSAADTSYLPRKSNRTVTVQAQCETKAEGSVDDFVIEANGTTYDWTGIDATFVCASR
jgi:hypothetical protein